MTYTQDDVNAWKQQYGKIYNVSMRGVDYIFRNLTIDEYNTLVRLEQNPDSDSAEVEDAVVATALLHPNPEGHEFDRAPAGVITSLADEILELSGFGSPKHQKTVLEDYRARTQTVLNQMYAFILATMPVYRMEDLDSCTFDQLCERVAMAEQIIRVNQAAFGMENDIHLEIIDPEEEAEKQRIEAEKHAAQKKPGQAGFNDPIAAKLQEALG